MIQKHSILKGAFILTATGLATRFAGFFYRIFLSRSFGEEAVGVYQLVFPVYALAFSFCAAGIQTAIARSTASYHSLKKPHLTKASLYSGFSLSVLLSFLLMLLMQQKAPYIAEHFLHEPRCAPLLTVLALALPFSSMHSCICGYYIGCKSTRIPAVSQLLEQTVRIGCVVILYDYFSRRSTSAGIILAAAGIVAGEAASSFFCLLKFRKNAPFSNRNIPGGPCRLKPGMYKQGLHSILSVAVPLTGTRVLLGILQSIEAVSIPLKLQSFGLTLGDSLRLYGILTGMALPCILFPSAITNSLATMLLPAVAEIHAAGNEAAMKNLIRKVFFGCLGLGLFFCLLFVTTGNLMGRILFGSATAGSFIITLAWICPFLYTNGNLIGILNGLGKTNLSFLFNTVGLLLRIGGIWFLIPKFGIQGYLWGLLIGQCTVFSLVLLYLNLYFRENRISG